MNDMTQVIVPKSDQINADDLISGPRTITITDVSIRAGTEQPVAISFNGDNGKPWKPCKSMSRVLVSAWGPDAKAYVGRSLTLYRDPKVKWGGMEVGGIRVSHMSDIERDFSMALTATKGKREPFMVKKLVAGKRSDAPEMTIDDVRSAIEGAGSLDLLRSIWLSKTTAPFRDDLQAEMENRKAALSFEPEGRTDADHGDQHPGDDAGSVAGDLGGDE